MMRFLIPAVLVVAAAVAGGESCLAFIDIPSLFVTVGGSLGVLMLSYPTVRLLDLVALLRNVLVNRQPSREALSEELKRLARLYRLHGSRALEAQENAIADPFLKRAVTLLVDLEGEQEIVDQMESLAVESAGRYRAGEQILATAAKLFPAFGLIGTLIGLVLLLREMSAQEPEALTSSFGLAIMTTLYGAVIANAVVLPLAAKLQSAAEARAAEMRIVIDWAVALARGAAPSAVERRLGLASSLNPAPSSPRPATERAWRILSWQR
jgi:chemotaxis protein MotA